MSPTLLEQTTRSNAQRLHKWFPTEVLQHAKVSFACVPGVPTIVSIPWYFTNKPAKGNAKYLHDKVKVPRTKNVMLWQKYQHKSAHEMK